MKRPKDLFSEKDTGITKKYKKQKSYCGRLYKKERKMFYGNLDLLKICENKTFWRNIQPFLSMKVLYVILRKN